MLRLGVDFGGTKIEAAALAPNGDVVARVRRPNPRQYEAALITIGELVETIEAGTGEHFDRIGMGIPGSISPRTGLVRNANSHWLNGRTFGADLEAALGRQMRLTNDANCMVLSEAVDGAAAGARLAFGVIIGTGCGGGIALDGRVWDGFNGIGGEIGHMPLPWPTPGEFGARDCWCGRKDCLETFVSGTAFVEDYAQATGRQLDGAAIVAAARAGEAAAIANLDRYIDRLGRALAAVCDILDPDAIVLAGGMSNVDELYDRLPVVVRSNVFSDGFNTPIRRAVHGDSSGVRGAAWLWEAD